MQFNTSECCFDGNDCLLGRDVAISDNVSLSLAGCIDSCNKIITLDMTLVTSNHKIDFLGDFICHPKLNISQCCHDMGDCLQEKYQHTICPACDRTTMDVEGLGNHYCNQELNTVKCCFDSGDCTQDRLQCASCNNTMSWFRDSFCDASLNNQECCFDGGDCLCLTCNVSNQAKKQARQHWSSNLYHNAIGNLQCDMNLNTPECCFDGFDCHLTNRLEYLTPSSSKSNV